MEAIAGEMLSLAEKELNADALTKALQNLEEYSSGVIEGPGLHHRLG